MTTTQPPTMPETMSETPRPAATRTPARSWVRYVPVPLVVLSLALAVQGQRLFNETKPDPPLTAMLYFGGATLLFLLATALASPIPLFARPTAPAESGAAGGVDWREFPLWRLLFGVSALVLVGSVLYGLAQLPRLSQLDSYSGYVVRWLAAIGLLGIAFMPVLDVRVGIARVRTAILAHRLELITAFGIVLLGGVLRLWALGDSPSHLNGDEASIGLDIQGILRGDLRDPFGLMWGPLPALSGFVMSWFYQGLGQSVLGLRLPGALAGTLAIGALYALARCFTRREIALGAALLLATLPLHIHYSRIAVNVSWDSFFFTATLALLYWSIERKGANTHWFLLAGLLAGFGQYTYSGARLLPLLVLGVVGVYALFFSARLRDKWVGLAGMAVLFLVIAAPLYLHALRYPNDFNARLNQTGIFQTGYVEQEKAVRNESTLGILIDQTRRALFGFAYIGDTTETWGANTPLVPILVSLPLFVGLLLSLRRWRDPAIILMHGWFWAVIIGGGALTISTPASNRLVAVLPVVCLFAALGWEWIAAALTPHSPNATFRLRAQRLALVILVVGTSVFSLQAYQGFLERNNYGGINAKVSTFIGRDLGQRPAGTTLIALTAPRLYANMSPTAFFSAGYTRLDYDAPVLNVPPDLPTGDLLIVATPERVGELGTFQQQFLTAPVTEVRDPQTNEILYYSLWVDR